MGDAKLPVVILTGYLGAGKTTFLNYVLNEQRDKKLAVIENEIGEVSVDDCLVEQKHANMCEELVVLNNGCVCCTIRGDLQKTLVNLAEKCNNSGSPFALGMEIEAHSLKTQVLNGVRGRVVVGKGKNGRIGVDFGPVHGEKAIKCENLKAIGKVRTVTLRKTPDRSKLGITLLDNKVEDVFTIGSIDDGLLADWNKEHPDDQIARGDSVMETNSKRGIASMDAVLKDESEIDLLIRSNPPQEFKLDGVLIELTGAADPAPVVQTFFMDDIVRQTFYVDNVIALVDAKHCISKLDESEGDKEEKGTACAQIAFSSTVLLNKVDLVDEAMLVNCEKRLRQLNGTLDVIRCEQARVPLGKLFNVRAFDLARVLEEQYMDEEEFNLFYKPKMDQSISNVGITCEGAINMNKFQRFLGDLIDDDESAKSFLRIKGVLNIQGDSRMFVLQCVHMQRTQRFMELWGKKPENRIIFIGRGMTQRRQELTDGFMNCLVKPLRFNVGDKVMAQMCGGSEPGTIIAQWSELNPYRIKLDSGHEVHAPLDEDMVVMAASSN